MLLLLCLTGAMTLETPLPPATTATTAPLPALQGDPTTVVLASGDELRVYVPGVTLEGGDLRTIDVEGTLDLGHLGSVVVAGLGLEAAEREVQRLLGRTLRDASAATLTLHARGVIVEVVGLVARPGRHVVRGTADPWTAVVAAGGALDDADLERVALRRDGHDVTVDVRRWLGGAGDGEVLPTLRAGDRVFVPARDAADLRLSSSVSVLGGVHHPGRHPLGAPTPLLDVLALAGGPTADADLRRITVVRRGPGLVASSVVDVATHPGRSAADILVQPGDSVMVAFVTDDPVRTAIKILGDVALVAGVVGVIVGLLGGAR